MTVCLGGPSKDAMGFPVAPACSKRCVVGERQCQLGHCCSRRCGIPAHKVSMGLETVVSLQSDTYD